MREARMNGVKAKELTENLDVVYQALKGTTGQRSMLRTLFAVVSGSSMSSDATLFADFRRVQLTLPSTWRPLWPEVVKAAGATTDQRELVGRWLRAKRRRGVK
jgi:hypothetical protein